MPGRLSAILAIAAVAAVASVAATAATVPTCRITGPTTVSANTPVRYSGTESYDLDNCPGGGCAPGQGIVWYAWDFGEPVPNFVVNGGFEGGWQQYPGDDWVGESWSKWEGQGDPQFQSDSSVRHGGGFSQRVNWTVTSEVDAAIYQTCTGLQPGTLYQLQAWVQSSGPVGSAMTALAGYDPAGGSDPNQVPLGNWRSFVAAAGIWRQVDWIFTATGTSITVWLRWSNISSIPVPGSYDGWADDVRLWKVTSSPEVCHIFTGVGTYPVSLTVADDEGVASSCSLSVTAGNPPSQPPTCSITYQPLPPLINQDVTFNANAFDPDGDAFTQWYWDFGDGTPVVGSLCDGTQGAGDPVSHRYTAYGTYEVTCRVVDATGAVGTCKVTVQVKNALPVCQWTSVSASPAHRKVNFNATASYDPDGQIVSYVWNFGDAGSPADSLVTNRGFEDGSAGLPVVGWTAYPLNEPAFGQNGAAEGTTNQCNIYSSQCAMYTNICARGGSRYLFAFSQGDEKNYGYYQTVTGLIPGAGYTATVYHANFNDNEWPSAGDRIGVDPAGGTSRTASSVIWSNWESTPNATQPPGVWRKISVSFVARDSRTATIFLESRQICSTCGTPPRYTQCWMNALDDVGLRITGASGPQPWYIFETPAPSYEVCLTVTDNAGATASCCKLIYIGSPASAVPTCAITYSPASPTEGNPVDFQANASDSDGTVVSVEWNFGDGSTASGDPVTHYYAAKGVYTASCTVTDNTATARTCRAVMTVGNAPPICLIDAPALAAPGEEIEFRDASEDPVGTIVAAAWDFGDPDAPAPADLTVANSSFENSTAWTLYRGPGPLSNYFEFCSFAPRLGSKFFGLASHGGNIEGGAYQTITGAVPGSVYRAGVWIMTRGWNDPAHTPEPSHPEDTVCRIGVDPTGGTDPGSPHVVWAQASNDDCPPPYMQISVDFLALAEACTVFVEFYNVLPRRNEWSIAAMDDVSVTGLRTGGYGSPVYHTYQNEGAYAVTLTVMDNDGAISTCLHTIEIGATVQVSIVLDNVGWHMISLPLEPINKNILLDRATKQVDPGSIFYTASQQGNGPRNRLFRYDPITMSYWVYNPTLYPRESWYEIGIDDGNPETPYPGPWWQGFWFLVDSADLPLSITYTAYTSPLPPEPRALDIAGRDWSWIMAGGFGEPPSPYDPDTRNWPSTHMPTQVFFRQGPDGPWAPTSDCDPGTADAYHEGWIGLPLIGYTSPVSYYSVSPSPAEYCGAQADTDRLYAGEGYWLDVEEPDIWVSVGPMP